MSVAKYPSIAVDLEAKIQNGTYRKKIPGTRDLAAEYNVSKQTITNALRPLLKKGLLKSEGRRGVSIHRKPKKGGLLCIVATGEISQLNADPDLPNLQEYIRADGFEVILISTSSKEITCHSICKLLGDNFIGVIFTNSSLTLEIAEYLEQQQIPFVSCNRLPIYSHLNWIEYDWSEPLREICRDFASCNYNRQALFFHGRLENYNYLIRKEWQQIKSDFDLPKLAVDKIKLDYRKTPIDCFELYLEKLHKLENYPQVLIIWQEINEAMSEMICNGKYKLPTDCIAIGVAKQKHKMSERIKTYELGGYYDLMLLAYKALREVITAPNDKFIHRIIKNPIKWNQPMPFDHCRMSEV